MMLEKDMENLIAKCPDEFFPNSGFKLVRQQENLSQRRVDIVFKDKYDRTIIIEIKRGVSVEGGCRSSHGILWAPQEGKARNDD